MDTNNLQLDDASRTKLDGIVQQMASQNAPTEDVQSVVSDFKQKYGKPVPELDRNLLQKGLGLFLDPITETAAKTGQAIGALGIKGAELFMNPEQKARTEAGLQNAMEKPSTIPILGNSIKPVSQETTESTIGRAVGTVALGLGNPALAGGAIGLGSAMQNNAGPVEAGLETAASALGGKIIELGFGVVSPYVNKALEKYGSPLFSKLEKFIPDAAKESYKVIAQKADSAVNGMFGNVVDKSLFPKPVSNAINKVGDYKSPGSVQEQVNKARQKIADTYKKYFPLTPTQISKEADTLARTGDNVYTTLAKNDLKIGSNSDGTPNVDEAQKKLGDISNQFESATQNAQKNEYQHFNLNEIIKNAENHIDERMPSETGRNTAKDKINKEIQALIKANPSEVITNEKGETLISSKLVERLRKTGNSWTPFNASDPERIGNSAGYALSNATRDQVEKQGTFPSYREANREWGKIIHAQEVLDLISTKKMRIPGGLSGAITRKLLVGGLGLHSGGLGGLVLSEIGGDYAAKILTNPELRTFFDKKLIERLSEKKITPDIVSKLEQEIKDYINKQNSLLRLPAGDKMKANYPQINLGAFSPKVNRIANDLEQNMRIDRNILKLPAPEPRLIVPNTQGTPNPLGRPYTPGGEPPAIGGMRQKIKPE